MNTTTADPRAALPAHLEAVEDAAAEPGRAAAEGGLDDEALAVLLSPAGGCCQLLAAARRANPAGAEAVRAAENRW
jgi:hypothetical protein